MKLSSYLTLSRHHIYYVRFPIPRHIHPEGRVTQIRVSLKTSNHREALYMSHRLHYDVERAIQHLHSNSNMNYIEIKSTIKERLALFVTEQKERRLNEGELCRNTTRGYYQLVIDKYPDYDFEKGRVPDLVMENAIRNADKLFPEIEFPPESEIPFLKEFGRQYPEALKEVLRFNDDPQDLDFRSSTSTKTTTTPSGTESTLKEAIDDYTAQMATLNEWSYSTNIEKKRSFNLLYEFLGEDFALSGLDKTTANKIKTLIISLPKNRKIKKETRELSIVDACAKAGVERISRKTFNNYLGDYYKLSEWLVSHGYQEKNAFQGLSIKIKDNGEKKRDAFNIQEIKSILLTLENKRKSRKGYQYWGVLLCLFTGARANEIAQLHLSDIKNDDGVTYIDINQDTDDKNLKTAKSKRIVPIHSYILDKGFLNYVDKLKTDGQKRLFPELGFNKKSGYGRRLSDWFNVTFLTKTGLKKKGLSLHSFRHSIVTELTELSIQDSTISKITGHSIGKNVMQTNYNHAKALSAMSDAIEKLPYV